MLSKNKVQLMRPLLASFARLTVPELDAALFFLADLNDEKLIDDGIRYLMYLVDPDALFDVALGTYDLKMAMMVAERSQKDPREWVPFLEQFRKLASPFKEYKIDVHLKRWHSALTHLADCCKTDSTHNQECLKLICDKGLFQSGLKVFEKGSELYKLVCKQYGDRLSLNGRKDEAGLVYSLGGLDEEAARAFALAGEEDLCSKATVDFTSEQKAEVGRLLASSLANKREYRSAARVAVDWCRDVDAGATYLLEGHHWTAAQRLIKDDQKVKSKLICFVEEMEKSFNETKTQVCARADRLVVVFNAKFDEAMIAGDGENFPDVISETETTRSEASSSVSQNTTRSKTSVARRKKKEERKSRSLREGSRTEDVALVTWLHSAITGVVDAKRDVRDALVHLAAFELFQTAEKLQQTFKSVLDAVSFACGKIWPFWLNQPNLGLDDSNPSLHQPTNHHFGPATSTADVVTAYARTASYRKFVRSRFMFMDPSLRFAPNVKSDGFVWSLSILAEQEERDRRVRVRGREDYGFV
jgi:elongator complex protein 1